MDLSYATSIMRMGGWLGIGVACVNISICLWEVAFGLDLHITALRALMQIVVLYQSVILVSSIIEIDKQTPFALCMLFLCFPLIFVSIISIGIASIEILDHRLRSVQIIGRIVFYVLCLSSARWILPLKN